MGFTDRFFDSLVGSWCLTGEIVGRPIQQTVEVHWILRGAYLQIHYRPSTVTPIGAQPYECLSHIGYDPSTEEYCLYLLDTFGAGYSPIGFGKRTDDRVLFRFGYPNGDFETTFIRTEGGWDIELCGFDEDGNPKPFGIKRLRPI